MKKSFHKILAVLPNRKFLFFFAVSILLALSITQRVFNAGFVGGLDYELFQPDGFFYSLTAYRILGYDLDDSLRIMETFYTERTQGDLGDLFSNDFQRNLMRFRFLYPLLSSPFVFFLGPYGMLVVPFACYCVVILHFSMLSLKNAISVKVILGVVFLLTSSTTLNRWYLLNYTESLSLLIMYFLLYWVYSFGDNSRKVIVFTVFGFLILAANHPEPFFAIAFSLWILLTRFRGNYLIMCFVICSVNIIPLFFSEIEPTSFEHSPVDLADFFVKLITIPFVEIGQLLILDRALLVLLIFLIWYLWGHSTSIVGFTLLILTVSGSYLQSVLIGAYGTNFRYFLHAIPVLLVMMLRSPTGRQSF